MKITVVIVVSFDLVVRIPDMLRAPIDNLQTAASEIVPFYIAGFVLNRIAKLETWRNRLSNVHPEAKMTIRNH